MTSFPKHSTFYKIIAFLIVVIILSSMAVLAAKRCHTGVASEEEYKGLKSDSEISTFLSNYFIKLHILHTLCLICGSFLLVLSFIDLVPHRDEDLSFAFHFVSVFVIAIIGFATLYASYVAYEKPCTATKDSTCCSVVIAPKMFDSSGRSPVTAFSEKDGPMIAIVILDATAALLLLSTSLIYFIDMRNDAKHSGYLTKVHNHNYLSRY